MDELRIICALVRNEIFCEALSLPVGIDWEKVLLEAGLNGVSAICCEAVKRLPPDRQPPFQLLLRWDVSSLGLQNGFARRHEVTLRFRDMLGREGLEMLLLKGESLADLYPVPSMRECGDVDFIAFRKGSLASGFRECNAIASGFGLPLKSQSKHTEFVFEGIPFENHDLEHATDYNASHHRTFSLLNASIKDAVPRADGCWELEPVMAAVFVVKHLAQHICYSGGRIALRMLLDLALLLRRHPEVPGKWHAALEYTGLASFAQTALCACDTLLGTGFIADPDARERRRTERFVRLFLTDGSPHVRYFVKFFYLPLTFREMLRIWKEKAASMLG